MENLPTPKTFTIGARGSLLSITQTTLIKNILEEKTPHKFEIKKISKPRNDLINVRLVRLSRFLSLKIYAIENESRNQILG